MKSSKKKINDSPFLINYLFNELIKISENSPAFKLTSITPSITFQLIDSILQAN